MSYLAKKEDAMKTSTEFSDSKALPRFSLQINEIKKVSIDKNEILNNDAKGLPRFTQISENKRLSLNEASSRKSEGPFKIGYGSLTEQICKRSYRRGFEFNLMIVGCSGIGKSTFVNSLLLSDFYNNENLGPSKRIKKTVYLEPMTVVVKENDVVLKLCLIDTPGFGDAVDNSLCWDPIVEYIDSRFDEYMDMENKVSRNLISDKRVHGCLYFIQPTGHSLKPLDIEFMKRVHEKVNIIPVIGKADTLTLEECRDFKKTISNQLIFHKIKTYDFPEFVTTYPTNPDNEKLDVKKCREKIPFAVIGSNILLDIHGRKTRGRRYPWGDVEVENIEHNDYLYLKNVLMRTHLQDLKDVTSQQLYEKYRVAKMTKIAEDSNFSVIDGKDPMSQLESDKLEQELKIKKMEDEMRLLFEQKAEERTNKLKESECDLEKRKEQMKIQLESQTKELDEQRRLFDTEKSQWEDTHKEWEQEFELRSSSEKLESKSKNKRKTLF